MCECVYVCICNNEGKLCIAFCVKVKSAVNFQLCRGYHQTVVLYIILSP